MLMGKNWSEKFKEFMNDSGLSVGCIEQWLALSNVKLYGVNPEDDTFEEGYSIDSDDHERLMYTDEMHTTLGMWIDGNKVCQWVSDNADGIHTFLWNYCDNYNVSMWELFDRAKCDNEVSWLLEDILQGKIENLYNINRFLGWFVCDDLLQQYQNIMGDLDNE